MIEQAFEESSRVGAHLDVARDQLRAERCAVAGKLLAAGRFAVARMAELGNAFEDMIVDDWELAAAELGAELGISRGRACTLITQGRDLIVRLPSFAEIFATGVVELRVLRVILHRTALITDPAIMTVIDDQLAAVAPSWNPKSDERIADLVDWMIIDVDPDAVRRARKARHARGITVEPIGDGMVEIHGRVDAAKGAVFDQQLDALARTVCPDDPRTVAERRADAVDALGATSIACLCGNEDCSAAGNEVSKGHIVIHALADAETVAAAQAQVEAGQEPGDPESAVDGCGDNSDTPVTSPKPSPARTPRPALIPGYGPISVEQLRDLLPYAAIRPLASDLGTESGYHPSRKLTDYVGCRDLICRCPGCTVPAQRCDTDHTTPWPYGPTHPSNTKLYCRIHHLIKTFHGWVDLQHPAGTITFTAPDGRVYTTTPDGALFFPALVTPTAAPEPVTIPPPSPRRELAAPRRTSIRAHSRAYRIAHERARNRAHYEADPPPF